MVLETNLNIKPYYDDFDPTKDYYKILFQPGVSVQTRELIQLQTIFQQQIERFGDNIFTSGTIISGCNLNPFAPLPYVKLADRATDGSNFTTTSFLNCVIENETTGLSATIITAQDGFVSADPDLKTLWLGYRNTGYDGTYSKFAAGDILTVYNSTVVGIEKIIVNSGASGFSSIDNVLAIPAIAVTVTSGEFTNGEYITNGSGANLQIIAIDTITKASSGETILSLKPRVDDLANSSVASTAWTLNEKENIIGLTSDAHATIGSVIGAGFKAELLVDPNGTIDNVNIVNKGFGFTTLPYITVQSFNNSSGISTLQDDPAGLTPQNWIIEVTVASTANAVGDGYGFFVGEGIIYQKGYFLRVRPQLVIVDKYSTKPDGVAACFITNEEIITSNIDETLNDPAVGKNYNAPGADRLRLTPQIVIKPIAEANSSQLIVAEWNEGNYYIQRQQTVYSTVGDKIAEGIHDTSGDFFINPFLVTTQSNIANDGPASFDIVVDPGEAYIQGYKIATHSNYTLNYPSSFLHVEHPSFLLSLTYNSYLTLKDVGGTFKFNTGDAVTLHDQAKGFITNSALVKTQNTNPVGNTIGTARMRSLVMDSLNQTNPTYKLYLFDIQMANGKTFADTKSIHYNGTANGIADVITFVNPTSLKAEAVLANAAQSSLVFPVTTSSLRNVSNTTYTFRTVDTTLTVNTAGYITKSISANASWKFPYSGSLSAAQLTDLYVVPTAVDLVYAANSTGTLSVNTATANVTGSATQFVSQYAVGDWVYIYGNATYDLKQVKSIANNTFMTIDSNVAFINAASNFARCFPKDVPIPLGYRTGLSANVDVTQQVLTINLGGALTTGSPQSVTEAVNITQVQITQGSKTPNRNKFIKLNLGTHPESNTGPWCLGVPDVFRLRAVYVGNSGVSNTSSNYMQDFYIDNNQNIDYYGLSWLYIKPNASIKLTTSNYLLVQFDYFTSSGVDFYNPVSYITSNTDQIISIDSASLQQLDSGGGINTLEIPEFFTPSGGEINLLQCLDFRSLAQATVTPSATVGSAPLNPSSTETFNSSEKYFPLPGSLLTTDLSSWVGNFVSVFIDKDATITTSNSQISGSTITSAPTPIGTMKIADVIIPPYPAIPQSRSVRLADLLNTGVLNIKYGSNKLQQHLIYTTSNIKQNQSKVYTQSDFAEIDRRLQNVEYNVSLNQSESELNNLVIPSSNDPSLARYKFGFFSDVFSTAKYLDITNPRFAASNKNGFEYPPRIDWNIYFGNQYEGTLPFILEEVLNQNNATIGTLADPNAQPECAIDIANTVAYQLKFRNVWDSAGSFAPKDGAVDVVNLTLADQSHMANAMTFGAAADRDYWTTNPSDSPVELFFYNYDNSVKIEIFQGNTLIIDTSSANNLTATDISNLTGTQSVQWFNDNTNLYMKNPVQTGNGFVMYAGKLLWDYNGVGGQNITIRTTNGTGVRNWKWVLSYPLNGESAGCAPPISGNNETITLWYEGMTYCGNWSTQQASFGGYDALSFLKLYVEELAYIGLYYSTDGNPGMNVPTGITGTNMFWLWHESGRTTRTVRGDWEMLWYSYDAPNGGDYYGAGFSEIVNGQRVPIYAWFNFTTDTLVITTSPTSETANVIQTIPNFASYPAVSTNTVIQMLNWALSGGGVGPGGTLADVIPMFSILTS